MGLYGVAAASPGSPMVVVTALVVPSMTAMPEGVLPPPPSGLPTSAAYRLLFVGLYVIAMTLPGTAMAVAGVKMPASRLPLTPELEPLLLVVVPLLDPLLLLVPLLEPLELPLLEAPPELLLLKPPASEPLL